MIVTKIVIVIDQAHDLIIWAAAIIIDLHIQVCTKNTCHMVKYIKKDKNHNFIGAKFTTLLTPLPLQHNIR